MTYAETRSAARRRAANIVCVPGIVVLVVAGPGCRGTDALGAAPMDTDPTSQDGADAGAATEGSDGAVDGGGSGGGDGGGPDFPPPGPPGGDACPDLSCLPCGNGLSCADEEPSIGLTCCAEGDALVHRGTGNAAEAVDIEVRDGVAFLCGGFGVRINRIDAPDALVSLGSAAPRCQHIATGPIDGDSLIFWLSHHGDTWVEQPMLGTYRLDPNGDSPPEEIAVIEDPNVLFEGIHYREGVLYAAAHGGGVVVYEVGPDFVPVLVGSVGGLVNASKLTSDAQALYVADGAGGVAILTLSDPLAPAPVTTIETLGLARDVDVDDGVLAVALGGDGVDVYDVSDPADPILQVHIETLGSAQAVELDGDIVAVAAWSHVAVYDRDTGVLLATERVRPTPQFEQDFGIAVDDGLVHVAEWEAHHVLEYRPGLLAPDIWLDTDLLAFDGEQASSRVAVVRNRGYLDLDIDSISTTADAFTPDAGWLRVPALSGRAFEVAYSPPGDGWAELSLSSNDPDTQQDPLRVPLSASAGEQIDVGDPLGSEFGFLSPTATVEGLEGHVVVLAYFALF